MSDTPFGRPTLHSRVESWECDFNGHWNTRFYLRSFRQAGEVVAASAGGGPFGQQLHLRFHRELRDGAAVQVTSGLVAEGEFQGHLVHFLASQGQVATTALDLQRHDLTGLPPLSAAQVAPALPRGLRAALADPWPADPAALRAEAGLIQPQEVDLQGRATHEELTRRIGIASQDQMTRLGYSVDYTRASGIGRMMVEKRLRLLAPCGAGQRLIVQSQMGPVTRSTFTTLHAVCTPAGALIATSELCMVAVYMTTRRACALPDFLQDVSETRKETGHD